MSERETSRAASDRDRSIRKGWTAPELREVGIVPQTQNDFTINDDGGLPS